MISDICLLVMTLTSGYWWSFWEPCTGNDSDICMLVMTLTYWYWCWLLSVYWSWLWYVSTNIPLISVYWWWLGHLYTADDSDICPLVMTLITVYRWWLWHLCTSHEEKKIHTDSRTDDKQQPTGAHEKVCLRFQLSRAKVFYGKSLLLYSAYFLFYDINAPSWVLFLDDCLVYEKKGFPSKHKTSIIELRF